LGRRPLVAVLHSSNEPGELLHWLCHDDSIINIVLVIIIIILLLLLTGDRELDINMLQQLKLSFTRADEILPKINAFKQYYVLEQELVYVAP